MRLLLSGEGPTDLGKCTFSQEWDKYHDCHCEGANAEPGPLAKMVDRIAYSEIGYSLMDIHEVCFVNEDALVACSKELRPKRVPMIPYQDNRKDAGFFRRNAQALGSIAKNVSEARKLPIIAILFRDCDGTNSSTRSLWQEKYNSMKHGFNDVGYEYGVPMIPKPKSEAWFLCALKENPYQNCADLENASGNDNSPNSMKRQLADALKHPLDVKELIDWIENGTINHEKIDMPSWRQFKDDFVKVLQAVLKK